MKKQSKILFILIALIVFGIIYLIISLTQDVGKTESTITMEKSVKELQALYKNIDVKKANIQRSSTAANNEQATILPDISEYPFIVNPTTDDFITIYASTEIANESNNSWLRVAAENFNKSNLKIGNKSISVGVRSIESNLSADFIIADKYTPEAYIPCSEIYGALLESNGKKYTRVSDGIAKNVSGIVISKRAKQNIESKHKSSDINTIINSVLNGESIIGYANPLSNEDGLNFLLTILALFNENAPLDESATNKLKTYQDKIPYVPYEETQLQESLRNGIIDGYATNYKTYYITPDLRNNYDFIPFGVEQNSPVYAIGNLTEIKSGILNKFVEFCKSEVAQKKAKELGYNELQDYSYSGYKYDGKQILEAQNLWKKEKNGSNDLSAVFVADISGSMQGSPILKLKASLNRASSFIDDNTNIGLVTFSDNVTITLPIAKFDNIQKSYFVNAVKNLKASGGTAMFDAIVVAENMLIEQQKNNPNTRLMIFVLTDGESNRGYEFDDIEEITRGIRIPIYTIGYNADIDVLEEVSNINEATTMNADSDNVIYKLESLFNSQM
ncbi:MAG: VWA domain-containing protein [Clostridia bacterium]|nr:VWA domain-containing protein [Clostridia bacterium]